MAACTTITTGLPAVAATSHDSHVHSSASSLDEAMPMPFSTTNLPSLTTVGPVYLRTSCLYVTVPQPVLVSPPTPTSGAIVVVLDV